MKTIERYGSEAPCQSCGKELFGSELSAMNSPYTFAYSDDGCAIVTIADDVENDRELRRQVPSASIEPSKFSISNSLNCPHCGSTLVSSGGPSCVQRAVFLDGMHFINSSGEYLVKIKLL